MQVQKITKVNAQSQRYRANTLQRKNRPGKDGSSKAGFNDGSMAGLGFHLLVKDLRPLSSLEVALFTGNTEDMNQGFLEMIDTETKQLQAIDDLYKIVRAQPKYKNLKEPVWSADTKPLVVINWLLRKLGPLAKGERWMVDTYLDGNKKRFRFVVYKFYNNQKVKNRQELISVDFLPNLKKRDLPLHELIVDILALVSRENKIPLWDEDGDFSHSLNDLLKLPISNNHAVEAQKLSYQTGPAFEYLKLLKQRRNKVTAESIQKQVAIYQCNSQRKQAIIWWIKRGLEIAATHRNINQDTFIPNHIHGNPITPFRLYKIIWSIHDHDFIRVNAFKKINKDEHDGFYLPLKFSITKPGEIIKPIMDCSFPELLYGFMSSGVGIFLWSYRDYFYKNQLDDKKTPAEQLLDAIELSEIQNL